MISFTFKIILKNQGGRRQIGQNNMKYKPYDKGKDT